MNNQNYSPHPPRRDEASRHLLSSRSLISVFFLSLLEQHDGEGAQEVTLAQEEEHGQAERTECK